MIRIARRLGGVRDGLPGALGAENATWALSTSGGPRPGPGSSLASRLGLPVAREEEVILGL